MAAATTETRTLEEQLAEMREEQGREEQALAQRKDERKLEEWNLYKRFKQETDSKRGEKFEILDFGDDVGFVVIVRGAPVLYQRLMASKLEPGDKSTFVLPQVAYPEREQFKALANECLAMWDVCCDELVVLHKARRSKLAGKA